MTRGTRGSQGALVRRLGDVGIAIAAAACGALVGFLVTPENRLLPFLWHHDDFNNLGWAGAGVAFGTVRPVSFAAWSLLGRLGPGGLYAGLFSLVSVFLALSVLWVAEVLRVRGTRRALAAVAFVTAAVFFLFEWSPWTLRYTGHTTNACSAVFGTAAALLSLHAHRANRVAIGAMLILFAASAFAKEDLVALPMLSAMLSGLDARRAGDGRGFARAMMVVGGFACIAAAALAYGVAAHSPFVLGSGTYAASFAPSSLADTAAWYAVCSRYARNLLVGLGLATGASIALGLARPSRWSVVWLGVASLIVPYLPLVAHRYALYASNWLPIMLAGLWWTIAAVVLDPPTRWLRVVALAAGVAAVISLYGISRKERRAEAQAITRAQTWSRQSIDRATTLLHERPSAHVVAVSGTDQLPHGPWFASNGVYLNRTLGREVRWIVLLRQDAFARRVIEEQGWPLERGHIVYVHASCRSTLGAAGVPILDVAPTSTSGEHADHGSRDRLPPAPRRGLEECGVIDPSALDLRAGSTCTAG